MRGDRQRSSERHAGRMQRLARAVLDAHGVRMFRAEVGAVGTDGKPFLRRNSSLSVGASGQATRQTDTKPSVRLETVRRLRVGDWVWCLQAKGHTFVLGRTGRPTDVYLDDIAPAAGRVEAVGGGLATLLMGVASGSIRRAWWSLSAGSTLLNVDKDGDGNSDYYALAVIGSNDNVQVGSGSGKRLIVEPDGRTWTPGAMSASVYEPQITWTTQAQGSSAVVAGGSVNVSHTLGGRIKVFGWVLNAGNWVVLPYGAASTESFGCYISVADSAKVSMENGSPNNRHFYLEIYR